MSKNKKYYKGKPYESSYTDKRFSNQELSLISNTFLDNLELIMALRKHFLQGNLLAIESIDLEKFAKNQELMLVIRKMFLPEIDPEVPLFQTADLWLNIDTKNKPLDMAYLEMKSRQIVVDYLEQQFRELEDDGTKIKIKFRDLIYNSKKRPEDAFVEMDARNFLITFIDRHLQELLILAVQHKTPDAEEEAKKRLQDSNK